MQNVDEFVSQILLRTIVIVDNMCDSLLKSICDKHQEYLLDLSIGYPFSKKRNTQLSNLIHAYHLLSNSELNNSDVIKILNYYDEY